MSPLNMSGAAAASLLGIVRLWELSAGDAIVTPHEQLQAYVARLIAAIIA